MIKALIFFFFTISIKAKIDLEPYNQIIINECKKNDPDNICPRNLQEINKEQINEIFLKKVEKLKFKNKINLMIINDPKYFIDHFYCYAIYQNIITLDKFDLFTFAYAVRGFSFTNQKNHHYANWLKTKNGQKCENELNKLEFHSEDFSQLEKYSIILNPITFYESGPDEKYKLLLDKTLNHELLHIYFAENKIQNKILKKWNQLTQKQQNDFIKKHPSYNFKNKEILLREYFSYSFEDNLDKLLNFK